MVEAVVLGESINALGVIRSLGRRGIRVRLVTGKPNDLARRSRYTTATIAAAEPEAAAVEQLLAEGRRSESGKPVLLYTSDRSLRLVAKHADVFAETFAFVAPAAAAVDTVTDKMRFAQFSDEHGLQTPTTRAVSTLEEVMDAAASIGYPVVLKPHDSSSWQELGLKIVRVDNTDQLAGRWPKLTGRGRGMLVQQYIPGPDDGHYSFVSYRSADGSELTGVTLHKVRVYPIHSGVGVFVRAVNKPELEQLGRAAVDALGYVGMSSVCFKVAAFSGRPFIHEVNGRLPLAHGAAAIVGIDLPYLIYADALGIDHDTPRAVPDAEGPAWVSLGSDVLAFLAYRRNGEITLRQWLRSHGDVKAWAEVARDDREPLYAALRHNTARLLLRR